MLELRTRLGDLVVLMFEFLTLRRRLEQGDSSPPSSCTLSMWALGKFMCRSPVSLYASRSNLYLTYIPCTFPSPSSSPSIIVSLKSQI